MHRAGNTPNLTPRLFQSVDATAQGEVLRGYGCGWDCSYGSGAGEGIWAMAE